MAYKPKTLIPDLEDIKVGEWYAITINPCDKYQYFNKQDRHNKCLHSMKDDILQSIDSYSCKLWPELSPKGRFHVHGIIKITNIINFYTYCIPALLARGTVVIKIMDNEEEWRKYCTKQSVYHDFLIEESVHEIPLVKISAHDRYQTNYAKLMNEVSVPSMSTQSETLLKKKRLNKVPVSHVV